jgi:hypothetical protein
MMGVNAGWCNEHQRPDRRRRMRGRRPFPHISARVKLFSCLAHGAETRALATDPDLARIGNRCGVQTNCDLRLVLHGPPPRFSPALRRIAPQGMILGVCCNSLPIRDKASTEPAATLLIRERRQATLMATCSDERALRLPMKLAGRSA